MVSQGIRAEGWCEEEEASGSTSTELELIMTDEMDE